MQLDDDFELSPARLGQLIRRLRHDPVRIGVALVEFEVNLLNVSGHVLVGVWLHINSPLMGMSVLLAFLAEVTRHVAVYYRFYYSKALEVKANVGKVERCEIVR